MNVYGVQSRNPLHSEITLGSEPYQLPHLFEIFHGNIISIEICICLLSWFSHAKLIGSCNSQGHSECANTKNPQMLGWKMTTHLSFRQHARTQGRECPLHQCPSQFLEKQRLIICLQWWKTVHYLFTTTEMCVNHTVLQWSCSSWFSHHCGCRMLSTQSTLDTCLKLEGERDDGSADRNPDLTSISAIHVAEGEN